MKKGHRSLFPRTRKLAPREAVISRAKTLLSFSLPCPHSAEKCKAKKNEIAERFSKIGVISKEELLRELRRVC
jgi:hypothetical protein